MSYTNGICYLYSLSLSISTGSIPFGFCIGASLGFGGLLSPGNFFCNADAIAAEASLLGIVAVVAATTEVVVGGLLGVVLALEEAGGCVVDDTGVGVLLGSLTGDFTGVLLPLDMPAMENVISVLSDVT